MRKLITLWVLVSLMLIGKAQTVNTFPYLETFEDFNLCIPACGADCQTLSNGWVNSPNQDDNDWALHAGPTFTNFTGPSDDHTPDTQTDGQCRSGKYLYLESSCVNIGHSGKDAFLISPGINLSGLANPTLEFWYHMYGSTQGNLHIDLSLNGNNQWNSNIIPSITDTVDQWKKATVSLSAWQGQTVYIRFRGVTGSGFLSDIALDDIQFFDSRPNDAGVIGFDAPLMPTCALDSSIVVSIKNYGSATLTSATVNWAINGVGQTAYNWTGSLPPGDTATGLLLGTQALNPGDTVTAWTTNPNGSSEAATTQGNDGTELVFRPAMNGNYTIGTNGDFSSFGDAAFALRSYGVCGPVDIAADSGTYNEQFLLTEIWGASPANTITFHSATGDSSDVVVTWNVVGSAENYTMKMSCGASFFRFEDLTFQSTDQDFANVVELQEGSSWNHFSHCAFIGITHPSQPSNQYSLVFSPAGVDSMNEFRNNRFEGGTWGLYLRGENATNGLEKGTVVDGNQFINQFYYGSFLFFHDAPIFTHNVYDSDSTYDLESYGYYFGYCQNEMEVAYNQVKTQPGSQPEYGMFFNYCQGDTNRKGMVYNNFISVGTPDPALVPTGAWMDACEWMVFAHNNIRVEADWWATMAFGIAAGNDNFILNNNFATFDTTMVFFVNSLNSIAQMDYNNYYTIWDTLAVYNGNTFLQTLADWQTLSGFDQNSITVDPQYFSQNDLHTCNPALDGAGGLVNGINDDIDGLMRGTPRDIGADEFSAPSSFSISGGADTLSVCSTNPITVSSNPVSGGYLWSTGDTTQSIVISMPGTYWLEGTSSCGVGRDTFVVVPFSGVYTGFLPADTTICFLDSINVSSQQSASTYTWSTGSIGMSTLADTGWVSLTITDACGTGTDSMFISPTGNTTSGILGNDTAKCIGDTIILQPQSQGSSYAWSTGDTTFTTTFSQFGPVWLDIRDGCDLATDTMEVYFDTTLYLPNLPADYSICFDSISTITSLNAGPTNYLWSTGATGQSITVGPGQYWLETSDNCGSGTDTINVASLGGIISGYIPSDTIICAGQTVTVIPKNADTYLWSNGSAVGTQTFTTSGIYTLIARDGCNQVYDTLDVQDGDVPTSLFSFGFVSFTASFTELTTGNVTQFLWSFGDGATSTQPNPVHTYSFPGIYQVDLIASNPCGTDTFTAFVEPLAIGDELGTGMLSLYPNPNTGTFFLDLTLEEGGDAEIRFMDAFGREVFREEQTLRAGDQSLDFDLKGLAAGIYFAEVRIEGGTYRTKFRIE